MISRTRTWKATARLLATLVVLGSLAGAIATGAALAADTTKPVTTATTSAVANAQGWYHDAVTVTLSAADDVAVQEITYSATGAQPIASTTKAGASASIVVSAEGTTTITYAAKDTSGNTEDAKTIQLKVDKTAPTISIIEPAEGIVIAQGTFSPARWTCTDGSGSGVATCEATEGSPATTLGIRGLDASALGIRYLKIRAIDRAGNETTSQRSYTVILRRPLDTGGDVPNSGQITAKGTIFMPSVKKCVRNNPGLKIQVKIPKGKSVLGAIVFFDGKRRTTVPSRRLNKPIVLHQLPKRRFEAKVTLVTAQGGKVRMTRKYRYCGR